MYRKPGGDRMGKPNWKRIVNSKLLNKTSLWDDVFEPSKMALLHNNGKFYPF